MNLITILVAHDSQIKQIWYGEECKRIHVFQLIWPITEGDTSILTWSANGRQAFIGH